MLYTWGCNNELGKIGCYYLSDWANNNKYDNRINLLEFYPVRGFVIDKEYKTQEVSFLKLPVLDFQNIEKGSHIFLPIGYKNCNKLREQKFKESLEKELNIVTLIHKSANLAGSINYGVGNWIQEFVNIQHCVDIGDNNIFWGQGVHIGHSSIIGSHNFISTNSTISGNCKIGNNCFFGVNTCIKDNIEIPDGTIVGMGSIITKSPVKPYQVFLAGVNNLYHKSALEI